MLLIYASSISLNQKLNIVCVYIRFLFPRADWLNGPCIKVELFLFGIVLFSLRVIFGNTSPIFGFEFEHWTFSEDSDNVTWDLNGKRVWNGITLMQPSRKYDLYIILRRRRRRKKKSWLDWNASKNALSTLHECQAHTHIFFRIISPFALLFMAYTIAEYIC